MLTLTQPFHVVADHTGIGGASVPLADTLADCEAFLRGDYLANVTFRRGALIIISGGYQLKPGQL